MKTFLFYDIETSGLNPSFDQVLTFASIRTDLALNEIKRDSITIRLRKDIVPSPGAFLTHGLTFKELSKGICEYEAAVKIHRLLNTPGTISLGYNSLGFDDEFLRFLFFRNLLDPYSHQYGNGCSRMDMLPIAVIYKIFHPDGVIWPVVEGRSSLKLEHISRENQFETSGKAHEAMSDVEALIALSRLLKQNEDIWNYCLDFFHKKRDEVRINAIQTRTAIGSAEYPYCLMASAAVGPDQNYLAPVIPIGPSKAYKNQRLWLRLDTEHILGDGTSNEFEDTFVVRKRYGDTPIILPALDRFLEKVTLTAVSKVESNIDLLKRDPERFKAFVDYHCEFRYPYVPHIDSDAALYQDGFFSAQEKKESLRFHQSLSSQDLFSLDQIQSDRVKQLAIRIIGRNFPDRLPLSDEKDFCAYINRLKPVSEDDPITGYKGDLKFNVPEALEELEDLYLKTDDLTKKQRQMLDRIKTYIEAI